MKPNSDIGVTQKTTLSSKTIKLPHKILPLKGSSFQMVLLGIYSYLFFENQQPENNINVLEAMGFDMRSPYLEKVLYKTIQKKKFAVWYNKSGFINAED